MNRKGRPLSRMFSPAYSWWPADGWPDNVPDTLLDICLNYLVKHPDTFTALDEKQDLLSLKLGVTFPANICEKLIIKWAEVDDVGDKMLHIFKNTSRTKLKRLNLSETQVTDRSIAWLMQHKPQQVNINMCLNLTSSSVLRTIQNHSENLVALFVGNNQVLMDTLDMDDDAFSDDDEEDDGYEWRNSSSDGYKTLFKGPKLQALSIHSLNRIDLYPMITRTLSHLKTQLVYLDLSECDMNCSPFVQSLGEISNLTTLILYDVNIEPVPFFFRQISKLKRLKALDMSQGRDHPIHYENPEQLLQELVRNLPDLTHLDLSGTNLSGFRRPEEMSHALGIRSKGDQPKPKDIVAIPGLEGRQFQFLGLLNCPYEACKRSGLPAKQVAGDGNEEQVILSVQQYASKCDLVLRALNNLFQLCRFSECRRQHVALHAILEAMTLHPLEKTIQISGSASLFYICKSDDKRYFSAKVKRTIIKTLLDSMDQHMGETTMLRNGCLTLCHFKIPQDVMFDYGRVVRLLLQIVRPSEQEEFEQHVGIYLLNSLACQVDGQEKQLVGDLGAIDTMLSIIDARLKRDVCDEVMEIAWSTMWNVTDETAINCERFIEGRGMELFLRCLRKFSDKDELLRNMMGLMGNVAEVCYLRPRLMESEFIQIFSDLLDSQSDGIEVSYNACGVLAHMVSDDLSAWCNILPSRKTVCQRMFSAISRWKLNTKRNINYRSFEPILKLLPKFDTPEAQHWATWALCNLTKVCRKKYCELVEKEQGLILLEALTSDPRPFTETKELALCVIRRCRIHQQNQDYESDGDMEVSNLEDDDND